MWQLEIMNAARRVMDCVACRALPGDICERCRRMIQAVIAIPYTVFPSCLIFVVAAVRSSPARNHRMSKNSEGNRFQLGVVPKAKTLINTTKRHHITRPCSLWAWLGVSSVTGNGCTAKRPLVVIRPICSRKGAGQSFLSESMRGKFFDKREGERERELLCALREGWLGWLADGRDRSQCLALRRGFHLCVASPV
ncbi:hypothetical protein LX32DRAFT_81131 [Colletotrichum zoysiae]|uniref:Uncharacterized protein n=1 Tax=Colletotrichum zoysiae TaxID=1216348 RepID=A0AAD9HA22_9PEZI|nr:hypothetical protein LX32DRAFT_81131 [Colletotrichum zoysiae]